MAKKSTASGTTYGTSLVIVESPTKAKTIRKFLGKEYIVESCMGHIRDLPQSSKDIPEKVKKEKWAQLGVNVDKHFEPLYCIPKDKLKVIKNLKEKLELADIVYLATDEDREGESISWHLNEVLKPKVPAKRMVFHEITKEAIMKALSETREIDQNLVKAQETRRILDRLVGYTISPLLWKKVAYGLSAGRVQSVAVRLIVEREKERIKFKKSNYYGLSAELEKSGEKFESKLISVDAKRIATGKDFDGLTGNLILGKDMIVLDEKSSTQIMTQVKSATWKVSDVEEKPVTRRPYAPFITSTLQQESNRKLGLSSRETMQVAQKLYEQGFITYMRTDSTFLSNEAIKAAREAILSKYGKDYLPAAPRTYEGKKVKGAQEAHEAIRPAGVVFQDPEATGLVGPQFKLYDLIWKRTMASQMNDAKQKQVSAKITVLADKKEIIFNSTGTTIEFPGFLRAYVEGSDDPDADLESREVRLPQLKVNDIVKPEKIEPTAHETKPAARYTEASLVQTMEKEGIGRPSTYASVIGTIIDRGYVRKQGNALIPTFTAMVVSKLLSQHLSQYVDLGFTSAMENSLDDIAGGDLNWEKYLNSVYHGDKGLKALVEAQADKIIPEEARSIKLGGLDNYEFHVGRYGAYVKTQRDGENVSASIPDAEAPADVTSAQIESLIDQKIKGADSLGIEPVSGKKLYVLNGRYGAYVQQGENDDENIKRSSLPPGMVLEDITFEQALQIIALPKTVGMHPELNKEVKVGVGRFGPYIFCNADYRSIPKTETVFSMTLEKCLEILAQPKKDRGKASALKDFGLLPGQETEVMVQLFNGPYGPYLKAGKTNVGLPEGLTIETLTPEKAIELVLEKVGTAPEKSTKRTKTKPKAKAKATAKKKVAKKK
ncbi:MAG: type I DNA topoisomerase [Bdellovibrionaceae bacterium]|nr:type I DNA topoisomerase [Pseudobdellovibrionaceae bacterium]